MPELGFVVYLIAISYAMGMLWYTLLGRGYSTWTRMVAFPLVGVVIGEAIWSGYLAGAVGEGLVFFNLHIYVALVSTFVAALIDMAFSWLAAEHHVADVLKAFEHREQPTGR
ncbi:MAG TPA: hypothetical protein VFA32_25255 [Dehalococcoidia bacterium]|jgi:L-cystine uptake protein TcyP (sodium:dicarboxylate symporter family)|nr:hypothetical protein [Dehalococcoidia bacterium]